MNNLLPPNASEWELRFATAIQAEIDKTLESIKEIPKFWNPWNCPLEMLPHLAKSRSVDVWDDGWSEDVKRQVVAGAKVAHEIKGTREAIVNALELAGYPGAVVKLLGEKLHAGDLFYDGQETYSTSTARWAEYDVSLDIVIPAIEAPIVRRIVEDHAPARSQLRYLDYETVTSSHNGAISYNGFHTHGGA